MEPDASMLYLQDTGTVIIHEPTKSSPHFYILQGKVFPLQARLWLRGCSTLPWQRQ